MRSSVNAITEAVNDRLVRTGRRRAALLDVASRLRRGAGALRAAAARDNAYYMQAGVLQANYQQQLECHHACLACVLVGRDRCSGSAVPSTE